MNDIILEDADAQDFLDVVCGLTVLGAYSSNAALEEDADRFRSLRRRIIVENREVARAVVDAEDFITTGVDPNTTIEGIRQILEDYNDY